MISSRPFKFLQNSDQPSSAQRGGADHTRAGAVRARACPLKFAAPALIPAPFIWPFWLAYSEKSPFHHHISSARLSLKENEE